MALQHMIISYVHSVASEPQYHDYWEFYMAQYKHSLELNVLLTQTNFNDENRLSQEPLHKNWHFYAFSNKHGFKMKILNIDKNKEKIGADVLYAINIHTESVKTTQYQ